MMYKDENTSEFPEVKPTEVFYEETILTPVKEMPAPVEETPVEETIEQTAAPVQQAAQSFAAYVYSGTVLSEQSGEALPDATVSFYNNGSLVGRMKANDDGTFLSDPEMPVTNIEISHVGYYTRTLSAAAYENKAFNLFPLKEYESKLPDVIVTTPAKPKRNLDVWVYLALGTAYLANQKKNKIGKIETGHLITVGVGAVMFLGFDTIKKLFEGIGFWDSKSDKDIQAEREDPTSPWDPAFAENAPPGAFLLTAATAKNMIDRIANAFGWFNDDEGAVYAVFNELKTQSELSSLSYHFSRMYRGTLLDWLTGSDEPGADHLSNEEVATINNRIKKLPKYTA